jgi:hypothetical protein
MPMGKPAPTAKQVASAVVAVAALLGSGTGAGYVLRESTASAATPPPLDRLVAVEKWQATEMALRERDRAERAELLAAIRDSNATNGAVRDAVIALNERMGVYAAITTVHDNRLRALESGGDVRPASGRR